MPEKPRDYDAELRGIMDALAESVAEASDADILAEAREAGEDPATTAARVRAILRGGAKDHEQRHLREAQKKYEERVRSMRERPSSLPKTAEARRGLFLSVVTRKPALESALLTAQHREFKDLTDADIQRYLEQLAALGALDDLPEPPGDTFPP